MKKRLFLAAACGVLSTGAVAQLGGGMPGGSGMPGASGRRSRGGAGTGDRRDEGRGGAPQKPEVSNLEVTLHEFHEDLKLRQEQEPLWQRYADSVRAIAADAAREARLRTTATGGIDPQAPLLQRIERVVDVARNRLAALEDIADRAKALFDSLSPEQRAAADPRLANIVSMAAGAGAARRPA
jgi:hypothetical protein